MDLYKLHGLALKRAMDLRHRHLAAQGFESAADARRTRELLNLSWRRVNRIEVAIQAMNDAVPTPAWPPPFKPRVPAFAGWTHNGWFWPSRTARGTIR